MFRFVFMAAFATPFLGSSPDPLQQQVSEVEPDVKPEPQPDCNPDPPPLPQNEDWPVDPKTAQYILDFLNGAKTAKEIAAATGIDPGTAQQILDIRAKLPGAAFTSLYELNEVWSTDYSAFALLESKFGPATMGRWDLLPYCFPFSPVNSALVHTGLVLLVEEANTVNTTQWDPSDLTVGTFVDPDVDPNVSQWCSHHVQLSDGRILFVGGAGGGPNPQSDQAHVFDPDGGGGGNGAWSQISDMNYERWYPTCVALGYPWTLVVGGWDSMVSTVGPMELYNEITGTFTTVPGMDSELYWPPTYPGLHPLPNGQIVFTRTGFSGSPPTPPTQFFTWNDFTNPTTGAWTDLGPLSYSDRTDGMSLMFLSPTDDVYEQKARIGVFGGGVIDPDARDKAEIIDAESLMAGDPWTLLPEMAEPREHCQAVLLPDGKAIIWGGVDSHGAAPGSLSSELFDPETDTFTRADDLRYPRGYHSVAALLPSGQVMAGGGIGFNNDDDRTVEIYSPPYLFKGPRPTITSVPSQFHHGDTFDVGTPDATKIDKVVLVRPVSYTHQTDSEQRVVQLDFTRDVPNDRVTATAPDAIHPHPHAPRGYYLLFILDAEGIPSVGEFVYLH